MRMQSLKDVRECETAESSVCKCRCKGTMHGANRSGGSDDATEQFFAELPEDDPHFYPSPEYKKLQREIAKARDYLKRSGLKNTELYFYKWSNGETCFFSYFTRQPNILTSYQTFVGVLGTDSTFKKIGEV